MFLFFFLLLAFKLELQKNSHLNGSLAQMTSRHPLTTIPNGKVYDNQLFISCKNVPNCLLTFFQIENGAKICKSNCVGCMPVHVAAYSGAKSCMPILIEKGKYILQIFH